MDEPEELVLVARSGSSSEDGTNRQGARTWRISRGGDASNFPFRCRSRPTHVVRDPCPRSGIHVSRIRRGLELGSIDNCGSGPTSGCAIITQPRLAQKPLKQEALSKSFDLRGSGIGGNEGQLHDLVLLLFFLG